MKYVLRKRLRRILYASAFDVTDMSDSRFAEVFSYDSRRLFRTIQDGWTFFGKGATFSGRKTDENGCLPSQPVALGDFVPRGVARVPRVVSRVMVSPHKVVGVRAQFFDGRGVVM